MQRFYAGNLNQQRSNASIRVSEEYLVMANRASLPKRSSFGSASSMLNRYPRYALLFTVYPMSPTCLPYRCVRTVCVDIVFVARACVWRVRDDRATFVWIRIHFVSIYFSNFLLKCHSILASSSSSTFVRFRCSCTHLITITYVVII